MIKELNKHAKKEESKRIGGITLIALVITIIVLLILAGVSIATLGGDNGIIGRAKKASTTTREKQADEEATLVANEYEMYKKMCETDGNTPSVKEFLEKKYKGKYEEDNGKYKITTDSGNDIEIDDSGNITVNDKVVSGKNTESITISGEKELDVGSDIILTVKMNEKDVIYKSIEWSVDTENVLIVGNGTQCTVTGVKIGSVTVNCKVTNYDGTSVNETYVINVSDYLANVLVNTNSGKGKYIQYNAGNVNSWRVLYMDSSNVYIICSRTVGSVTQQPSSIDSLMTYLKTSSNWSNYVDSNYALSATGAPTGSQVSSALGSNFSVGAYFDANNPLNGGNWVMAEVYDGCIDVVYNNFIRIMAIVDPSLTTTGIGYRPVVKLKSGIKVKGGDGTVDMPYILIAT